jgi:fucose permease
MAFNVGGIIGGGLIPFIATYLAGHAGLGSVGLYLSATALISLVSLFMLRRQEA